GRCARPIGPRTEGGTRSQRASSSESAIAPLPSLPLKGGGVCGGIEVPSLTPLEIEALRLSLQVGLLSVVASLPFGLAIAWVLARRRFPGKLLLDGIVHLPPVLPPVVVGFALLVLFGRNGPIGAWLYATLGITFAFNWKGAALASAV